MSEKRRMPWAELRERLLPALDDYLRAAEAEDTAKQAKDAAAAEVRKLMPGNGHKIIDALKAPYLCEGCEAPASDFYYGTPVLCVTCERAKRERDDTARIRAAAEALLRDKETPPAPPA